VLDAMRRLEDVDGVIFAENLTIGDQTWLRFLTTRRDVDQTLRDVESSLRDMGGAMEGTEVRDAVFEDLFTTMTRGARHVEDRR
jgi:hypothetical protein